MGRIVRDHYPVDRLPEDLRQGFSLGSGVRVTVEPMDVDAGRVPDGDGVRSRHFSDLKHLARDNFESLSDVDTYVAGLRAEWDR